MRISSTLVLGICFIILLGLAEEAPAQVLATLPTPINQSPLLYSSPYGPRVLSGEYQFHKGVDYRYPVGTPIFAVQGSAITAINIDGLGDWYIGIAGGQTDAFPSARFSYLHIFDNSSLVPNSPLPNDSEGNPIYGSTEVNVTILGQAVSERVTLEPLGTQAGPSNCFAVIFWLDFANDIANYALSPCAGIPVGHLVTTNKVPPGQLIAAVGQSGAAAGHPHLHLQVNGGAQNELLYVQHDHSDLPIYPISVFKDKGFSQTDLDANKVQLNGGEVLDPTQDSPLRIRTEVNYQNAGHDLDDVQILMYKEGTPQPDLTNLDAAAEACLQSGLCKEFAYGGTDGMQVSVPPQHGIPLADAIFLGVYPQPAAGGGVVDFLSDAFDLTTLDPGNYTILVRAINILGSVEEKSFTVTISSAPFSVSASCDQTFSDGKYFDQVFVFESLSGSVGPGVAIVPPTLTFPLGPAGCGGGYLQLPCPGFANLYWNPAELAPSPAQMFLAAAQANQGGSICITENGGFFCPPPVHDVLLHYSGSPPLFNPAFWAPLEAGAPAPSYITAFRVQNGLAWVAGVGVFNISYAFTPPPPPGSGVPPNPAIPIGNVSITVPVPIAQGAKPLPPRVLTVSCP